MSSRRRRPLSCKAGSGISDCVDEERGSCDDMAMTEYGGGASIARKFRGGRGGGWPLPETWSWSGDVMVWRAGCKIHCAGSIHEA